MKKNEAEVLAIRLTQDILTTNPELITSKSNYGAHSANEVADFIETLARRLEESLDDSLLSGVASKK